MSNYNIYFAVFKRAVSFCVRQMCESFHISQNTHQCSLEGSRFFYSQIPPCHSTNKLCWLRRREWNWRQRKIKWLAKLLLAVMTLSSVRFSCLDAVQCSGNIRSLNATAPRLRLWMTNNQCDWLLKLTAHSCVSKNSTRKGVFSSNMLYICY